ncbi:hypothetical protein DNTS_034627 [Danionella cerebrum]|uniref:WAPL domain-containing protein n=1 Tax=Danionella cerebrum TaxID=2873325 RepID=A0A553RDE6_9TELE|nr:hypothetical protein DNTS_034627 [Danionella translucida]
MTSRFSKTYTRKGGEASSKFDEVFSNKKATLTTKWGESTYRAHLGIKRPSSNPEVNEVSKRPHFDDDDLEDPFGFDSDEESERAMSRGTTETDSVTAGTKNQQPKILNEKQSGGTAVAVVSAFGKGSSTSTGATGLSSPAKTSAQITGNVGTWSRSSVTTGKSVYSLKAQSTNVSSDGDSFSEDSPPDAGEASFSQAGVSSDGLNSSEQCPAEPEPPVEEPVDFEQLPLLKPSNDRVYKRPKNKESDCSAAEDTPSPAVSSVPGMSTGAGVAGKSEVKPAAGRGRVRDYTVLHPSCVSVFNVTIQDTIERSVDDYVGTVQPDIGEAGAFRRKADIQSPRVKPTPSKSKSKKETKLEFFGFEENEALDADGDAPGAGSTSYKIKYFGFDDLSESDSEEDDELAVKEKNHKKTETDGSLTDSGSPQFNDSQESQQSQCSESAASLLSDSQELLDESEATASQKEQHGKQSNKSKDIGPKIFSRHKKSSKAVYNARHWNQPEPEEPPAPSSAVSAPKPSVSSSSKDSNSHKDDGVFKAPPPPPKVIKSVTIPTELNQDIVTALKCRTEHKELYTVVQHVKHFNDVVEFGENQEFTDDFEYLETGLKSTQPLNTRCLSIISLATRCAMPSFRMHLRARGKVAQVFKMLSDAQQHPNLALCTASLMYILSRDRLNMDLDRSCLELMIRLLELEHDDSVADLLTAKEMSRVKEKIRKICETVHNKHLDLENINTGHLAMETLLSLTSKRAGDWFKEELRLLGGLDHIVDKVKECVENLNKEDDKESLVASLWGAERCLRVLESVTVHNPENQAYLIAYKDSQLIVSSARALYHCKEMIQRYSREVSSSSALPQSSHSNVGKAVEDCMRAVPRYLPQEQRFDIRVLGLGLLINLVEYSARNRQCLVEMEVDLSFLVDVKTETVTKTEDHKEEGKEASTVKSSNSLAALVQLFLEREQAAVLAEAQTDDLISDAPKAQADQSGEWQETSGEIQWVASETSETEDKKEKEKEEEDEELDLNKALQHAGKHMEDSIVASYTALLLGCLCQESPVSINSFDSNLLNVKTVRENLPKGDFSIMSEMLKKFLNFMNLTCSVGTTGQKSISRVIDYLEHC